MNEGRLSIQLFLPHEIVGCIVYHLPFGLSHCLIHPFANHLCQEKSVAEGKIRGIAHRSQKLTKLSCESLVPREHVNIIVGARYTLGVNLLHQIGHESPGDMT
ncbi:hypothetical protein SDC9_190640 [bioreactor metagenome]|uniref:Uncharacterized protein n=1 Tax=bioreactor metagenome TaxID=1076179 RepID=A0A645HVJ5_9ZZZZ